MVNNKELKNRTSLYINQDYYQKLKFLSVAKKQKLTDCINDAIGDYLKKNSKVLESLGLLDNK